MDGWVRSVTQNNQMEHADLVWVLIKKEGKEEGRRMEGGRKDWVTSKITRQNPNTDSIRGC